MYLILITNTYTSFFHLYFSSNTTNDDCITRQPGADLTGGHSCSVRRGLWEAWPWRPPGPGRL